MADHAWRDCVVLISSWQFALCKMSSTTLLRKAGLRTVASGRRTDSGKTSFVNSDVRPFRLLDTLSDGNSDARARLRTCAAAPDPQASEKVCIVPGLHLSWYWLLACGFGGGLLWLTPCTQCAPDVRDMFSDHTNREQLCAYNSPLMLCERASHVAPVLAYCCRLATQQYSTRSAKSRKHRMLATYTCSDQR